MRKLFDRRDKAGNALAGRLGLDERHLDVAIAVEHADKAHKLQARIVVMGDFLDHLTDGLFSDGERGPDFRFDLGCGLPIGEQQDEHQRERQHARDVANEGRAQGLGFVRSKWGFQS
jgi:hypothetical protein